MKFEMDLQTFSDLEIFDRSSRDTSIFNLFSDKLSDGGKKRLTDIFLSPFSAIDQIKERGDAVTYFRLKKSEFKLDRNEISFADFYLTQKDYPVTKNKLNPVSAVIKHKFRTANQLYILQKGILSVVAVLNQLYDFSLNNSTDVPKLVAENNQLIFNLFDLPLFRKILLVKEKIEFSALEINEIDHAIRHTHKDAVKLLFDIIYDYECLITVSQKSLQMGFSMPVFNTDSDRSVTINGLFHPFITHPVANDVQFSPDKKILFLSGPNMAGKSTFLKSFSVAVYLAHLGLPVPAASMSTSVFDGISTTINIQDNLGEGYSHFYSEVLRVKEVAEKLSARKKMIVIFDELFRGTNVKDAYDGSLAIINAFSKVKDSFFIISTHIVEIAAALQDNTAVDYIYFNAQLRNNVPDFDYQLKHGVSSERLGMWIIENEGVVELIEKCS